MCLQLRAEGGGKWLPQLHARPIDGREEGRDGKASVSVDTKEISDRKITATRDGSDYTFIGLKKDAKYSYKKADGYFSGVASIGGLIVGVENLDGNANVKFRQADTIERLFSRLERQSRVVIQNFRADCVSFS